MAYMWVEQCYCNLFFVFFFFKHKYFAILNKKYMAHREASSFPE